MLCEKNEISFGQIVDNFAIKKKRGNHPHSSPKIRERYPAVDKFLYPPMSNV